MELGVKQRVVLLGTLTGVTGNVTELRILRELREALSFSEEEHAALKLIVDGDGRMQWETEADQPKEIEVGDVARKVIVTQLKMLSDQGELADDHLDIIDLFPEVEDE